MRQLTHLIKLVFRRILYRDKSNFIDKSNYLTMLTNDSILFPSHYYSLSSLFLIFSKLN